MSIEWSEVGRFTVNIPLKINFQNSRSYCLKVEDCAATGKGSSIFFEISPRLPVLKLAELIQENSISLNDYMIEDTGVIEGWGDEFDNAIVVWNREC